MKPILFHVGSWPIYSYSAMVAAGYLAGLAFGWIEARRLGQDVANVADISIVMFIAGILGARGLEVIIFYKRFVDDPLEVFRIWNGGLTWYGGMIAGILAGAVFIRIKKLDLGLWADMCAPAAMLMLGIGRIGCFLNGCCYGKVAPDLPWGVVYPATHPHLGLYQYKVHPTPLYSSAAAFILFGYLAWRSRRKKFDGEIFWQMVFLYAIARFSLEFFRADHRGALTLLGVTLSTSQIISLAAGAVAAGLFLRQYLQYRAGQKDGGLGPDELESAGKGS